MKPTKNLAIGLALIASIVLSLAIVQSATAATNAKNPYCSGPKTITNADFGMTITLLQGECATLSLDPTLIWDTPKSSSNVVDVYDVPTFAPDQMWGLYAAHPGTAEITSTGRPHCDPGEICPKFVRLFEVKIRVVGYTAAAAT